MSYLVFARKWRPQNFDEIIGQEQVTTTLKNAISTNRVAHAYIFTGPRGIGKTSAARIFAKSMNCEKGPTSLPCGKCASCQSISSGTSMDVMEIDGASNNSVDQIRELRENIKFSPSYGRYKIYIIDEVHMLSIGAFNALLKTLEEPPAHAKFIFATTNSEKVPPTVLSRCQRFDFARISFNLIVSKLKKIAHSEKLNISEDAIFAIARASDGSMRDAESVLDQLASFSEAKITGEDVINVLGMVDEDKIEEIIKKLIEKDAKTILKILDEVINKGKDISQFIVGIMGYLRNMMILSISQDLKQLIDFPESRIEVLKEQAKKLKIDEILYIFYVLSTTLVSIKRSEIARFITEAAFIKLSLRDEIIPLPEIMEKLNNMNTDFSNTTENIETSHISEKNVSAVSEVKKNPLIEKPGSQIPEYREDPQSKKAAEELPPTLNIDMVKKIWPQVLQAIKGQKMSIASYLLEGNIAGLEGNSIVLTFLKKFNFHKETLEHTNNKKFIEGILSESLGQNTCIKFVTIDENPASTSDDILDMSYENGLDKDPKKTAFDETIIQSALEIFNGKIVRIKDINQKI